MKLKYKNTFILILISFYLGLSINAESNGSPIPDSSSQIIMVITDYTKSSKGVLTCFERNDKNSKWKMSYLQKIPVVLGTNGLGWGRGLNKIPDILDFPIKKEGDGRSPAGIFKLSSVFGYKKKEKMKNLKMPYTHINEMTECVDDVNSKYYNMITGKKIRNNDCDWKSSEKMYYYGNYYKLGVIIDHNFKNIIKGAGSCIFLHNWKSPDETMPGCTAMEPEIMKKIVYWLDIKKKPVFIQLTKQLYRKFYKLWKLPGINIINSVSTLKSKFYLKVASGDISFTNAKNCAQFFTPCPQSFGLSLSAGHASEKCASRLVFYLKKIE